MLGLAAAVAVSPLPIVAIILILATPPDAATACSSPSPCLVGQVDNGGDWKRQVRRPRQFDLAALALACTPTRRKKMVRSEDCKGKRYKNWWLNEAQGLSR